MSKLRIAIAQMNPTVGDYPQNLRKILAWIQTAEKKQADVIVFPEMSLCGYPVWDLATKPDFVDRGKQSLQSVIAASRKLKIAIVLGYIEKPELPGGRSQNAMAWIEKGAQRACYVKRLLPTYDVFLEDIFFQAGKNPITQNWKGLKAGLTICEDLWDDAYPEKPLRDLFRQKADFILNISASPYYRGVSEVRENLVKHQCRRYGFPLVYSNLVGGQDDLVFDGRSFFCDAEGRILFRAPAFNEGLFCFDWNPADKNPYEVPRLTITDSIEEVYQALLLGIRDYCAKNHFKKVVIGLSGGIDSALVAALAVDALGPEAVLGVTMPGTYSSKGSWKDSQELAKRLGIKILVRPIKSNYERMVGEHRKNKIKKITPAMENLQARLRGLELMYISNDESRLVLTTGNKSELAMGYCTLYGDMAGGLAVIGDVYKTDVYRLAWHRNREREVIPKSILEKAPSAELRPNQKDEDSLPPYEILDEILFRYIENNAAPSEIAKKMKHKKVSGGITGLVKRVIRQVDHNEYKRRQTPPILRVTQKAWFGRRMPITNRFEP